jgi:2-phosphosulfolactate phosphatase
MKTHRTPFKLSYNIKMKFSYLTNENCHSADGVVVVIDVLRAFSTAAYAFGAGAESITLVGDVEEALSLKAQRPEALIMGEVHGVKPESFDFGNSPTEIARQNLQGKHLIQRTSAGTQGVVRSVNAEKLFTASFVVADATVCAIQQLKPEEVSFVITGRYFDGEDKACADYLAACLQEKNPDPESYLEQVRAAFELAHMPTEKFPHIASDVDYSTRLNAFPFAMPVTREQGRPVMHALTLDTGD